MKEREQEEERKGMLEREKERERERERERESQNYIVTDINVRFTLETTFYIFQVGNQHHILRFGSQYRESQWQHIP